jgi:hypothetical protein
MTLTCLAIKADAIQPSKDPLEVPVGPVTRLRAKKFKEAFNGLLQDTWAKVHFKRICNNKEQSLINLIHVQEGLVGGTKRPLHKDWEKKTRFGQFDLSLLFWS